MKIFIYKNKLENKVFLVDAKYPANITEEELNEKIEEYNNDEREVVLIDVEDIVGEAFLMLLGEDKYKRSYNIRQLIDRIESLREDVEGIGYDLNSLESRVSNIKYDVEKLEKDSKNE